PAEGRLVCPFRAHGEMERGIACRRGGGRQRPVCRRHGAGILVSARIEGQTPECTAKRNSPKDHARTSRPGTHATRPDRCRVSANWGVAEESGSVPKLTVRDPKAVPERAEAMRLGLCGTLFRLRAP